MKLLHLMLRVIDLDRSIAFFRLLGLHEVRRKESEAGRFTLVYLQELGTPAGFEIELTLNWGRTEPYGGGNNFGHIAIEVDDINAKCDELAAHGAVIARPPRDGRMAFVKTPDGISIELLQRGGAIEPREPYTTMANVGTW
jgi:lactoylglutathione lyase